MWLSFFLLSYVRDVAGRHPRESWLEPPPTY
jgi:hypothetical protein